MIKGSTLVHMMRLYLLFLLAVGLLPTQSQRIYSFKNWATLRDANWSNLLFEPSAFVVKSHVRLRNRPEGYQPGARCTKYVGMGYLDHIRDSGRTLCAPPGRSASPRKGSASGSQVEPTLTTSQSSVECYTAPYVPVGFSNKASISLCRSRNLVLNTCAFFAGRRKGTLNKKFPMPARGAVRLGCDMANYTQMAEASSEQQWLKSIHHDVWWANATRDTAAVEAACKTGSANLVTTPTLFVMRDRHANYAHEMEVVSMAFSFLAALEPKDVAERGLQVVIVDQAPPTGFLETWARISRPHRLRILAHDPFPPNTCFRSAYHVYTFAAGIGYNTNGETATCESPVATGMSHWLRQLYEERDPAEPAVLQLAPPLATAATAGPVAAAAGVRGMRAPTSGIVMKNVVWLSRRNLELVRLLLNASVGWKSMRMVRNEDAVVAGMLAAVQEWNAESCLLRRFERDVQKEYELSLTTVNPVHLGPGETSEAAATMIARRRGAESSSSSSRPRHQAHHHHAHKQRSLQADGGGRDSDTDPYLGLDSDPDPDSHTVEVALEQPASGIGAGRTLQAKAAAAASLGNIDEHGNDGDDEVEAGSVGGSAFGGGAADDASASSSSMDLGAAAVRPKVLKGLDSTKTLRLEELWADAKGLGGCRRSNVLFTFVDGDFNDMPYHQQLKIVFRTGVLVGVHGAGLTHGFFMSPGQSAVLQLLGDSFAKVAANNVFRNMAVGLGDFYEDVLYQGVDVKVSALKAAVKRAMDFVAQQVTEAQLKQHGGALPPLVLDDQSHFSVVVPSPMQCPRNRTGVLGVLPRQHRKSKLRK